MAKNETIQQRVAHVRDQIKTTKAMRQVVEDQHRSRDQVAALFAQRFDQLRDDANAALAGAVTACAQGASIDILNVRFPGAGDHSSPLMALALVDLMGAALMPHVEALPAGLAPSERASALSSLAASIRDLEIEEEILIRQSEEANSPVERRADAPPDVVLATDLGP